MIIASSKMKNVLLEKSVLASAYVYADCLNDMTRLLTENDFTTASNRAFYGELAKCSRKGYVPEISLMMPKIDEVLQGEILSGIFGGGISSSNTITKMCYKLREVTICRDLVEKAERACMKASTGIEDYHEFTSEMMAEFNGVNSLVGKKGFRHVSEFGKGAWTEVEEIKKGTVSGIKTGNPDIDGKINGFKGGELVIIAARPAEGKTSLALTWAVHQLSQQGKKVGIISMEMSGKELLLKEVCMISKALQGKNDVYVPSRKMRNSEAFTEKEHKAMKRAQGYINNSSLYIDDTAALTMTEIESSARMLHRQKGLDILYVDYVGLISAESTRDDRHKHIQDCSLRLKRLARELDIPVVMVVQLNRDAANKRPHMSNLAESSQLERDADFIFLIYTPDTENKNVKIVINDKCRSLAGEDYYCNFCTDTTLFTAMTPEGVQIVKDELTRGGSGKSVDSKTLKEELKRGIL